MDFDFNSLKLIVGLGNIGSQYDFTRHNAGFIFVDRLAHAWDESLSWGEKRDLHCFLKKSRLLLAKPTTLMNRSGQAVNALSNYFQIEPEQILVVHDDLDLALGEYKIQFATGPKEHGGIKSVENYLDTKDFWRLRLGIESRPKDSQIPGVAFVLQKFMDNEMETLIRTIGEIYQKHFFAPHIPHSR